MAGQILELLIHLGLHLLHYETYNPTNSTWPQGHHKKNNDQQDGRTRQGKIKMYVPGRIKMVLLGNCLVLGQQNLFLYGVDVSSCDLTWLSVCFYFLNYNCEKNCRTNGAKNANNKQIYNILIYVKCYSFLKGRNDKSGSFKQKNRVGNNLFSGYIKTQTSWCKMLGIIICIYVFKFLWPQCDKPPI